MSVKNLRALREEKGLTQIALGEKINAQGAAIYKYESSTTEPNIQMLIDIADYFQVSVDYLMGHTDIRRKYEKVEPHHLNNKEAEMIKQFRALDVSIQDALIKLGASINEVDRTTVESPMNDHQL